jgi:hypothetical protein
MDGLLVQQKLTWLIHKPQSAQRPQSCFHKTQPLVFLTFRSTLFGKSMRLFNCLFLFNLCVLSDLCGE